MNQKKMASEFLSEIGVEADPEALSVAACELGLQVLGTIYGLHEDNFPDELPEFVNWMINEFIPQRSTLDIPYNVAHRIWLLSVQS